MITGRQIRAARSLLEWDAEILAAKAGLSRDTIFNIESGRTQARESSLNDIVHVFDIHGVEFIEQQGVRFKSNDIEVYEGPDRFTDFFDFMYEYLKHHGGDICAGGHDARLYCKYRKNPEIHRERMTELVKGGKVKVRFMVREGDDYLLATSYAQFKWQPKESFVPTSFYAFGECLALVSFVHETPPYVVLLKSGPFAEAYRQAFDISWKQARDVPPEILEKAREQ
jgi:transcriptional regulator with XRE-family HTH domain